jgi:hypothetical protein
MLGSPANVVLEKSSSKEHPEQVFRVEFLIMEMLLVPLWIVLLRSMLIIKSSFARVIQACKCLTNFFESICSLWSPIFVWMESESQLLVSFLQLFLGEGLLHSQNFVIVLL